MKIATRKALPSGSVELSQAQPLTKTPAVRQPSVGLGLVTVHPAHSGVDLISTWYYFLRHRHRSRHVRCVRLSQDVHGPQRPDLLPFLERGGIIAVGVVGRNRQGLGPGDVRVQMGPWRARGERLELLENMTPHSNP